MSSPGLYIHVPFCTNECACCELESEHSLERVPFYLGGLEQQVQLEPGPQGPFDTLYLGGGSPSCMSAADLQRLLESVQRWLPFAPATEVTVEIDPLDADRDLLTGLRGAGVTRVQLAADGLVPEIGLPVDSRCPAGRVDRAVKLIRDLGFDALGIDLLCEPGMPGAVWMATVERALEYQPEHLTCHGVTFMAPGALDAPDAEERAAEVLYGMTCDRLQAAGYEHYESASFSRGPAERLRHNLKYWHGEAFLGLGPGAQSFDGCSEWWNLSRLDAWLGRLAGGQRPLAGQQRLDPAGLRRRRLASGLRCAAGVDRADLDAEPALARLLERLQAAGLVATCNGHVQPTRAGLFRAEGMAQLIEQLG